MNQAGCGLARCQTASGAGKEPTVIRIGTSGWALAWQAAGLDVYAYFNNNQAGYAVVNAQQMKQRAGLPAPQPA